MYTYVLYVTGAIQDIRQNHKRTYNTITQKTDANVNDVLITPATDETRTIAIRDEELGTNRQSAVA